MQVLAVTLQSVVALTSAQNSIITSQGLGPATFTAPGAFPTTLYSSYYNAPTATDAVPQPVISDPVLHKTYPLALTNPDTIPQNNTEDPRVLPPKASDSLLLQHAKTQITSIQNNALFDTCTKCQASLEVAKFLALAAPDQGPELAVFVCNAFWLSSTCEATYEGTPLGAMVTQVLASADVGGFDGQMICENFFSSACPVAPTTPLNLTGWFAKPKPDPLPAPKVPSGERLKVLHLSDLHLDPRYAIGAEANCSSGLCCRENNHNKASPNASILAAPRYGSFLCDSPLGLVTTAFESIPTLTDTADTGFNFTLYTGDLVSHDPDSQLSEDYVRYTETVLYDLMKRMLQAGPVYAALGNHDSYNQDQDAIQALGGDLATQFSWNYDHVSSLWEFEGWINQTTVDLAKAHYAAYMVKRVDGLRIITLNTDLWYRANWFAYINQSHIDPSGMMRFLTDELQEAEDAGDRVWILGHVLSGWDGTNALKNPTDLFYQIVDRFSPHVIANIFFGHTHEDELSIFYANNGTNISADTAQTVSWMGPSLTPLTNLNAGFRMYEVDSATFDVLDAHTWRSDVSSFPELDSQIANGPTWVHEYSTREAYGANITWGANDPLNATWWHLVTEAMEADSSLVATFNTFQGKESILTADCTGDCVSARICYIRSGSSSLAQQNCPAGFGSVQ
ncbi:Metallo-dependent phosphatase [Stereum hirsutum FP-91666 SS1]|uniref:Metallo-dependent phosphatase n=1 Tax=Stereum hirsutum (strain FP-91666) TaxID=721885 RepID=UPI000440F90F|nr:Metallo-dependent phosphatase [Stereum hirsutum FP-91666 SS1]EIM92336.1 Metallo-dependent phosphatase [Stereum hirsutum FP-91666 SS1]